MWRSRYLLIRTTLVASVLAVLPEFIEALRNVSVSIPLAVKRGDNAILICNYDIENDTLYTVKWYRGRREFYRYTPKEKPAWKIFSTTTGLNVDTAHSNASNVFLRNVSTSTSGRYACEVSADAPSFHTSIIWAEMNVIELPTQRPIITGVHSRYRLGDVINGNCSSDYSKPAANLTWWINDIQVPPNYLRIHDIQKHIAEQLETSVLEINFIVTLQHFIKGRVKLKCSARIHRIYHAEMEKYIEEDKPRILASGRSPETFPYDFNDELSDENGFYLTHFRNLHSSSAQSNVFSLKIFIYMIPPAINCLFFIWFHKSLLNLLILKRDQQTEQQHNTTKLFKIHKTTFLQALQQKQHQKILHYHINYQRSINKEYNKGFTSDYDSNNSNDVDGKTKVTAMDTTEPRKFPCQRNTNKMKNLHSLECHRHVTIATGANSDSDKTVVNKNDTVQVIR